MLVSSDPSWQFPGSAINFSMIQYISSWFELGRRDLGTAPQQFQYFCPAKQLEWRFQGEILDSQHFRFQVRTVGWETWVGAGSVSAERRGANKNGVLNRYIYIYLYIWKNIIKVQKKEVQLFTKIIFFTPVLPSI